MDTIIEVGYYLTVLSIIWIVGIVIMVVIFPEFREDIKNDWNRK